MLGQNLLFRQPALDHVAASCGRLRDTGPAVAWELPVRFCAAFLKSYSVSHSGVVGPLIIAARVWRSSDSPSTGSSSRETSGALVFTAAVLALVLATFGRPNVVMFHVARLPALLLVLLLCRRTGPEPSGRALRLLSAQVALNVLRLAIRAMHVTA